MLPELQDKTLENVNKSLRERAALRIVYELLQYRRLMLDKQGLVDEAVLGSVFDTMKEQSWKGAYRASDRRPIRFMVLHMGTRDLLSLIRHETEETFINQFVQFVSSDSAYTARAQGALMEFAHREFFKNAANFSFKFRNLLRLFGNPPYEEKNSNYPMTVPIFNIHFAAPVPEDPNKFFSEYNSRMKNQDVFSRDEIAFVQESAALVNLVDGMLYQSKTHVLIASQFFPYQAIAQRYGFAYESWLGFGPNDELMDVFRKAKREQV